MTKVFLSYRREDSGGYAGRIQDQLVQALGSDILFMDVDAIPLGANFVRVLHDEVAKCEVLLAVIGRNWSGASTRYPCGPNIGGWRQDSGCTPTAQGTRRTFSQEWH